MAGPTQRRSIKQQGRDAAVDALRKRCFARVRAGRESLLDSLRGLAADGPDCTEGQLRQLAHEALQDVPQDDWLDEEAMIALEQEIYEELCAEVQRAQDEAQHLEDLQNEEDCALFEQHLLPGVHCPLCRDGRLQNDAGLLRCSNCQEMRVTLMDELLSLDDICEQLGDAEVRHQKGGCLKRGHFEATGDSMLIHRCEACGWSEIVF
ncbi:hypothetical protein AK812_SmicGene220 [Symbiodinium microadriaticum]|uniref:RPA-interacting protein C-terminal domain-containing protein n=1 Tax=Symbiodinium microadriaticum TaxID=2951 RepID=A0A1Q9F7J7_SYMMI|nr:hypothetical protein AK812_SmicGene220 [Symbiodinium microadriaticum]